MSYASIVSENIANAIVNQITIKYCFNKGNISGTSTAAGIAGWIYGYVGTSATNRGGVSNINVSYNWNFGHIYTSSVFSVGGVICLFYNYIYSNNCFFNSVVFNNFNIGSLSSAQTPSPIGGTVAYLNVYNSSTEKPNVGIDLKSNYNYSTSLYGGNHTFRAGIVGQFVGNCSSVTLLNNYSAYKRKTNEGGDIDNNIYGTNPATPNGANVGEYIICLI